MVKLLLLHIYAQNGVWFDVLNAFKSHVSKFKSSRHFVRTFECIWRSITLKATDSSNMIPCNFVEDIEQGLPVFLSLQF